MEYTTDYTIYTPQLKSDDGKPIRINPTLGNFTYGLDDGVLEQFGLNALSFCFFILWGERLTGELNREIWLKKEISIPGVLPINLKDRSCFDQKFFQDEPQDEVERKLTFFRRYGLEASYLVIRDLKKNFALEPEQKVAIRVGYDGALGQLIKSPVALEELQGLLVKHSNKKMVIGKPLNYYETDLEKYLQLTCKSTGALFPGDCDLLLYDRQLECRLIVEFKKTTYRDKTPLEQQSFLNHMDRDRNKYTRLNILRNYFSQAEGRTIPFVTVFYSVRQENKIKLERISTDLQLEGTQIFETAAAPRENQLLLLEHMLELCAEP